MTLFDPIVPVPKRLAVRPDSIANEDCGAAHVRCVTPLGKNSSNEDVDNDELPPLRRAARVRCVTPLGENSSNEDVDNHELPPLRRQGRSKFQEQPSSRECDNIGNKLRD